MDWFRASPTGVEGGKNPPDQGPPPEPPGDQPPPESTAATPPGEADVEQVKVLAYYWFYEKMNRLIYGSQTLALDHANKSPGGVTKAQLQPFLAEHSKRGKGIAEDYEGDWNRWIAFIIDSGLLQSSNDHYEITPLGRGFLQWMAAEGLGASPML